MDPKRFLRKANVKAVPIKQESESTFATKKAVSLKPDMIAKGDLGEDKKDLLKEPANKSFLVNMTI